MDRTERLSHLQFHIHVSSILTRWCCGRPSEVVPSLPFGSGADLVIDNQTLKFWLETVTLFSGLGTDVHFPGDESGMQWEDCFFELQNAVERRRVMFTMSIVLGTCDCRIECSLTKRQTGYCRV